MTDYPTRRGELLGASESGGWNVYDNTTDSLHVLNDSARAIWELCDGTTNPDEMASAISELAGLNHEEARDDVRLALGELRELGLVGD